MALDGFFGKKFKLETSDNFDNYMKALGKFLKIHQQKNTIERI